MRWEKLGKLRRIPVKAFNRKSCPSPYYGVQGIFGHHAVHDYGEGATEAARRSLLGFIADAKVLASLFKVPLDEVCQHVHIFTPERYVGATPAKEDSEPFEGNMNRLVVLLREQQTEETKLDVANEKNLKTLSFLEKDI